MTGTKQNKRELLTAQELAAEWKISVRSIYNGVSSGNFPVKPVRIGKRLLRWRKEDVDRYIDSR